MKIYLLIFVRATSVVVAAAMFAFSTSCKKAEKPAATELITINNTKLGTNTISAVGVIAPPSSVSSLYDTQLDPAVSDDFNGSSVDMSKWQYRTNGTSAWGTTTSDVYIAQQGSDSFVSIKGTQSPLKGSGISTKTLTKYGFFITRWQAAGWNDNSSNGWHPAIWGAGCDFSSSGNGNCIPEVASQANRLEADFMEGFNANPAYWNSHILLWNGSNIYQNINFKPNSTSWPNLTTEWITMGFEYTPNYIALWSYSNGTWTKTKQVPITTGGSSSTNINVAYRTPLYWILSNKSDTNPTITGNSWLHVDYFYRYAYTGPL